VEAAVAAASAADVRLENGGGMGDQNGGKTVSHREIKLILASMELLKSENSALRRRAEAKSSLKHTLQWQLEEVKKERELLAQRTQEADRLVAEKEKEAFMASQQRWGDAGGEKKRVNQLHNASFTRLVTSSTVDVDMDDKDKRTRKRVLQQRLVLLTLERKQMERRKLQMSVDLLTSQRQESLRCVRWVVNNLVDRAWGDYSLIRAQRRRNLARDRKMSYIDSWDDLRLELDNIASAVDDEDDADESRRSAHRRKHGKRSSSNKKKKKKRRSSNRKKKKKKKHRQGEISSDGGASSSSVAGLAYQTGYSEEVLSNDEPFLQAVIDLRRQIKSTIHSSTPTSSSSRCTVRSSPSPSPSRFSHSKSTSALQQQHHRQGWQPGDPDQASYTDMDFDSKRASRRARR
jgi:hypothetical protein